MQVCLIIGCHPCWEKDYAEAKVHYPEHKICAVNYAAELIKADYIATSHASYLYQFVNIHKRIHGTVPELYAKVLEMSELENVTYLNLDTHGGSGVFGAAAMVHIGFDLAIMCGCPLDGSGGYAQTIFDENNWHVDVSHPRIRKWHQGMVEFRDTRPDLSSKMRSMSGSSKEIFGGINDN